MAPAPATLSEADREVVDLVTAALVDPSLHTDTRMRLAREIGELLERAHTDAYGPVEGPIRHAAVRRSVQDADDQPSRLLHAVLVDPDLHTELRMRLFHEIPELVRGAQGSADEPAS